MTLNLLSSQLFTASCAVFSFFESFQPCSFLISLVGAPLGSHAATATTPRVVARHRRWSISPSFLLAPHRHLDTRLGLCVPCLKLRPPSPQSQPTPREQLAAATQALVHLDLSPASSERVRGQCTRPTLYIFVLHDLRRPAKTTCHCYWHQSINQSFCDEMPRYKDESPAVRVYTVSDESRYLIVRNVPALGCGDDLLQLFSSYGQVDECKPMDAEDCEPYTDVYWIKFRLVSNARFAKRKLDDSVFLGNRLQVSYAPHFETLSDTKDKLEGRRREVLARLNPRRSKGTAPIKSDAVATSSNTSFVSEPLDHNGRELEFRGGSQFGNLPIKTISSNEDYFSSHSMNQTVKLVRDKLDKIRSSGDNLQPGSASKKARVDNRRRI